MILSFPVVVCSIGALVSFSYAVTLRRFKLSEKPPASRAGLSLEQRQAKIKMASWLCVASGIVMLAEAIFLARPVQH